MSTWQFIMKAWDWEPSIVIGCVLLLAGYLALRRFHVDRHTFYFIAGGIILLVTLVGPLDVLADDYLFSAHMLEHLILELIVPPLMLLGIPSQLIDRLLAWKPAAAVERVLGTPVLAWIIGIGTLWIWHFPKFYNAALASESLHIFQHLTFLVTATIFWWPILAPDGFRRTTGTAAIFYLYFGALANGTLGALLTFAPIGFYPMYLHPNDELGALSLIRRGWGMSPSGDQQLGGLFMWVIGGVIFLWALMAVFARWYLNREGRRRIIESPRTVQSGGNSM